MSKIVAAITPMSICRRDHRHRKTGSARRAEPRAATAPAAPEPMGSWGVVTPPPEEPEYEQSALRRELRLFRWDLQLDFRQEFLDIRASLDFNQRIDNLYGRMDAIESQVESSTVSAPHRVLEELKDRD